MTLTAAALVLATSLAAATPVMIPAAVPGTPAVIPAAGHAIWYFSGSDAMTGVLVAEEGGPIGPGVVVEVDPGDHLEFVADHDGLALDGRAVVRVWTTSPAHAGAAQMASGEIRVSLLSCERGTCRALASTRLLEEPWARDGALEPREVELPPVDEVLESGGRICVRIDVLGDHAITVGYGGSEHPSSVALPVGGAPLPASDDPASGPGDAPPEPNPAVAHPAVPDDRSDLVSHPGFGGADGLAAGLSAGDGRVEPGWLVSLMFGVVVTSAFVAMSALGRSERRVTERDIRTRRPPGRPAPL
ncbi:MAG: hypothetical protein ACFCVC_12280 [Acidimicrobiia bacterium]